MPALEEKTLPESDFFFEHQTSCANISGDWKLVRARESEPWELIDLQNDPFEQNDVSVDFPEKATELEKKWNAWAEKNNVLPFESTPWTPRIKKYKELNPDQDGVD